MTISIFYDYSSKLTFPHFQIHMFTHIKKLTVEIEVALRWLDIAKHLIQLHQNVAYANRESITKKHEKNAA